MTINTNYSLFGTLNSNTNSTTNGTSATDLSSLLSTANSSTSTDNNASLAYLLNLSPEAQNYLSSGLTGSMSSTSNTSSDTSFTLTKAQQSKLDAIIQKYKGQPYTQDTFDAIQKDLVNAGISPDQIAQQTKVNAFNPTLALLDALSGTDSNSQLVPTDSELDTKKANYVKQIAAAFEKVAAPDTDAADTTSGAASTIA